MNLLLVLSALIWHDEKVSASGIVVQERELIWTVDAARSWLEPRVRFPAATFDLSETQLQGVKEEIVRYLAEGLSVEINGKVIPPAAGALTPELVDIPFSPVKEQYIGRMKLEFRFASPEPIRTIKLGVRFFADQPRRHQAIVTVVWAPDVYEFAPIGPAEIRLPPPSALITSGGKIPPAFAVASSSVSANAGCEKRANTKTKIKLDV